MRATWGVPLSRGRVFSDAGVREAAPVITRAAYEVNERPLVQGLVVDLDGQMPRRECADLAAMPVRS